ncbi:hypothetical protein UF75_4364 [Desulfosporosinus sp. I2]|uniref:hypothetical protein n=1 Tax=Desulfosporosinus sp. I2 TaxID=1617025 RepID=UPI0005ED5CAB|nr:hypothetical protein [Desulfosporosinus sp. I2]KJR45259.1 hypothetical protein UF75_4364 [Desulfosporosinus sp. I2]
MPNPDVWKMILRSKLSTFSTLIFAGLVKNAGKTTALNAINTLFPDESLGLTSLGYDGETQDAIYRHPKPSISVRTGQIILTAERFLPDTPKRYDILETWGNHPQFGSWQILKITAPGDFRMAGPSALSELVEGISRLRYHGARRIHVDGALNRLSHISVTSLAKTEEAVAFDTLQELSGREKIKRIVNRDAGIVLSTSAALGNTLNEVIERTLHNLELFQLPSFSRSSPIPLINSGQDQALPFQQNAYFHQGSWSLLPTFLWNQALKVLIPAQTDSIYLKGALTDSIYLALRAAERLPYRFIVRSPAHVLLSPAVWNGLKSRGIEVTLLDSPHLAILTLCPWHPITPIPTERMAEALLPYIKIPMVDMQKQEVWLP